MAKKKKKKELTIPLFKFRELFEFPFGSIVFYRKIHTLLVKITTNKFRAVHRITSDSRHPIRTTANPGEKFWKKLRITNSVE